MAENFTNEYQTTLDGGIDDTVTSFDVVSAVGAPAANFRIRVDDEYMLVTGVAGETFTVTRGVEGSAAAAHSNGADVTHVLTAGGLAQAMSENAGGGSLAQVFEYPEEGSLSGDSTHCDDLGFWTDNSTQAFTAKEILGGSILHLQQIGANKASRLTRTLSNPRSPGEAYDVRIGFTPSFQHGNANDYVQFYIQLSRADYPIYMQRFGFLARFTAPMSRGVLYALYGNGGGPGALGSSRPIHTGEHVVMRLFKGTDNVLGFQIAHGERQPLALAEVLDDTNKAPLTWDLDSSGFGGTGAQVDQIDLVLTHHASAGSTHRTDIYIDYVQVI